MEEKLHNEDLIRQLCSQHDNEVDLKHVSESCDNSGLVGVNREGFYHFHRF